MGRADGRVPGRAGSHPRGRPGLCQGRHDPARPEYEKGLRGWRKVLDDPEFNSLIEDPVLGGDLCDVVRRYQRCLAQDDLELKDPIIPQAVIDKWGSRQGSPLPPLVLDKKTESPPATQENAGKKRGRPPPAGPSGPEGEPRKCLDAISMPCSSSRSSRWSVTRRCRRAATATRWPTPWTTSPAASICRSTN